MTSLAALVITAGLMVSSPPVEIETLDLGEYKITHYCRYCNDGEGTSTGAPLRDGIVAGNPSEIPYGSTVVIAGKEYLMADYCGASQSSKVLDIYVESDQCKCAERGTYQVEVRLIWNRHPR